MSNLWVALILLGAGVWLAHDGLAPRPSIRQSRGSWTGALAGDCVRQLELRPVVADILDQALLLRILHAQRDLLGTDVDDLALFRR